MALSESGGGPGCYQFVTDPSGKQHIALVVDHLQGTLDEDEILFDLERLLGAKDKLLLS